MIVTRFGIFRFYIIVLLLCVTRSAKADEISWANKGAMNAISIKKVIEFYEVVVGKPFLNIEILMDESDRPEIAGISSCIINDRYQLEFDAKTGVVYGYEDKQKLESSSVEGLSHRGPLSRQDAFARLSGVLSYLSIEEGIDRFQGELINPSRDADNLGNSMWMFSVELAYKGVPCRLREFMACVSPMSGDIQIVNYRPVIAPRQTLEIITKEEALDIARQWVETHQPWSCYGIPASTANVKDNLISKVVAVSNLSSDGELNGSLVPEGGDGNAYYCWEITVDLGEQKEGKNVVTKGAVWVSVESGEIIGRFP